MTNLTARQIRYYEDQGLITPARNDGNQRIFSLNDIDRLIEIKTLIDKGLNIAGIKAVISSMQEHINILPGDEEKIKMQAKEEEFQRMIQVLRDTLYNGR